MTKYQPEQLIFLDETACAERMSHRSKGWSPYGITPTVLRPLKKSDRFSVLPAYTLEGWLTYTIVQGGVDKITFIDFLENKLLPLCQRDWSVICLDNCAIHYSDEITQLCSDAGVSLEYLPPYSPDFNPIEEAFAELKAWMRSNCEIAAIAQEEGKFEEFLHLALKFLGDDGHHRSHFKSAGYIR